MDETASIRRHRQKPYPGFLPGGRALFLVEGVKMITHRSWIERVSPSFDELWNRDSILTASKEYCPNLWYRQTRAKMIYRTHRNYV